MNAIDLRQPTHTEALSPAVQRYLLDRVRAATLGGPQQWQIRLYQCLADRRSAETLCQDLWQFVLEDAQAQDGLVAVFECPPGEARQEFAPMLWRHLQLLRELNPRVCPQGRCSGAAPEEDEVPMRIAEQDFELIVMHAEAERLSRVMPCPVLIFRRC